MVPDRYGLGCVLEPEPVPPDALEPEVVGLATQREDEVVVGDRAVAREHAFAREVESRHFGHAKLEPRLAPENRPHRPCDVLGFEARRGHLVEQRLEQVIVVAVEQYHVHRRSFECAGGAQPAEPGADNDNGRSSGGGPLSHRRVVAGDRLGRRGKGCVAHTGFVHRVPAAR